MAFSAHRTLFQVATMVGIIAAASLFGCGGETTGGGVTTNGAGATGGVQGTAASYRRNVEHRWHSGASGCPGTGGPTMVRLPEGYCIDSTEVTRGQYQAWLDMNPPTAGQISDCTWNTTFFPDATCMTSPFSTVRAAFMRGPARRTTRRCAWTGATPTRTAKRSGKRLCGKIGGGSNGVDDNLNAALDQWYNACVSDGASNIYPYGNTYQPDYCNGADYARARDSAGGVDDELPIDRHGLPGSVRPERKRVGVGGLVQRG